MQAEDLEFSQNKTPSQMFFYKFCEDFQSKFFDRTPPAPRRTHAKKISAAELRIRLKPALELPIEKPTICYS